MIDAFIEGGWDYLANCSEAKQLSVPDGFDVEVFRADLLERAASQAALPSELEHVTPWFRKDTSGLNWGHYQHRPARPYYRVSVDDVLDLEVVRAIVEHLHSKNSLFGVDDVVDFLDCHPEIASKNLATVRNEGFLKSLAEDIAVKSSPKPSKEMGRISGAVLSNLSQAEICFYPSVLKCFT